MDLRFKLSLCLWGVLLSHSIVSIEGKKVNPMESFTYNVFKDVEAVNIQQLKDETSLRDHSITINLPDIDFNPKKEKSLKRVFKLISFEFAESEGETDENAIPELGLTTFQITSVIKRLDKPKCNKTLKGSPSDCDPVTRKSSMEFFGVPFDASKKFHRTYGQVNAGFNDPVKGIKENYLIYHNDLMETAAFDYPDTDYPKLGVSGDAHIDMYVTNSHRWIPRCNRKENRAECIRQATCGAKHAGNSVEKDANFCCLCAPGSITNSFPTPCGVNITDRYESFLKGDLQCGEGVVTCPYNPNPMKDVNCRKTFGSCPMTCKCGPPQEMHPCIHPFTMKPKYPLYPEAKNSSPKRRNGSKNKVDPNSSPLRLGISVGVVIINAILAAILC